MAITATVIATGVATAAAVGGAAMGAIGAIQQGQAAAQQAKGQQAIAEYNAQVQQRAAQAQQQSDLYKGERLAESQARQASALQAQAAASGATPTTGAPLLVQQKQAEQSEMDRLILGYNSNVAQQQDLNQSTIDTMQASIYGQQASNYQTAGMIGAGTSLMSGMTDYWKMKKGYN
jgi:hypothetical protein